MKNEQLIVAEETMKKIYGKSSFTTRYPLKAVFENIAKKDPSLKVYVSPVVDGLYIRFSICNNQLINLEVLNHTVKNSKWLPIPNPPKTLVKILNKHIDSYFKTNKYLLNSDLILQDEIYLIKTRKGEDAKDISFEGFLTFKQKAYEDCKKKKEKELWSTPYDSEAMKYLVGAELSENFKESKICFLLERVLVNRDEEVIELDKESNISFSPFRYMDNCEQVANIILKITEVFQKSKTFKNLKILGFSFVRTKEELGIKYKDRTKHQFTTCTWAKFQYHQYPEHQGLPIL